MTRYIKESIHHWIRMIKWVAKQPKIDCPSRDDMTDAIGQTWDATCCSLCIEYQDTQSYRKCVCANCPLSIAGYGCQNTDSLWRRVDQSKSWGEWLANAAYLLECLKEVGKND